MISEQVANGPLSGIRVLDLSTALMGPYCAQILSDLGSEVTKVEPPEGDTTRALGPTRSPGHGGMFINMNRGKRSIVIDLKQASGRATLIRLVEQADVFVHSMRRSAIARLGLDYAALAARNPRIIYLNLYGFGSTGPYANRPAYDDVIQAMSGLAAAQTELSGGQPSYVASVIADKVGGLTGAYALMAALFERERSGQGQEIEVPMFEAMTAFMFVEHSTGSTFSPPMSRPIYKRAIARDRRPYCTADGYISVLIYNDNHWRRFANMLGAPAWSGDPRLASLRMRDQNLDFVLQTVSATLLTDTTANWLRRLGEAEIPAAPILATSDLLDDAHLNAVDFWHDTADEDGALRLAGIPTRFMRTPAAIRRAASKLGADTRAVLGDAGFADAEIEALLAEGAVGVGKDG